ncbi:MAG TPA: ABC transporter permease [Terriglobales bacterium]|nr:ABC transporter permease [Terriglobales bacterium]
MRDFRLALRRLAHQRGFALVAILTLAVGIGANTAIFSLVDGVLLRPLAFPQPRQLISLDESVPQFTGKYPYFPVNAASFHAWEQQSKLLSGLAIMQPDTWVMSGVGEPLQVSGAIVSGGMLKVLGIPPRLGRDFLPSEDMHNQNHVVILSDAFWRSQFHSDPGILGRTIDLDGAACQVVGVMPPDFPFPYGQELGTFFGSSSSSRPMQIFRPAGIDFASAPVVGNFNYISIARMKPGVTTVQVRAELNVITANMLAAGHAPASITVNAVVTPLRDMIVGDHGLGLWMLLAAVGAILLIVCLNLANLLLVRVHGRGHELAIRLALGASRARLIRETVAEGLVLAAAGGVLGIVGAEVALRWLVAAAPAGIPRLNEVALNPAVLAFAILLALLCGFLFSLWPALRSAGADPQSALRSGGRSASDSGHRLRARAWLVGAQSALAAVLLVVAGLLTASYWNLLGVNKGFQPHNVITAEVEWQGTHPQRIQFYRNTLAKLAALSGVQAVGLIDTIPTQGVNDTDLLSRPGDTRQLVDRPLAAFSSVSPGYFQAMGIPLLRGRTFTEAEVETMAPPAPKNGAAPPIPALVSEYTAAQLWPGKNPLGQQFGQSEPEKQLFTVIGVVADVRAQGLDKTPGLAVYLPYTFNIPSGVAMVMRTDAPLSALAPAVRSAVWSVQPAAAIPSIASMGSVVSSSVAGRRFQLSLVLVFAVCALFLAALGIYGVIAYSIERRTGEISIRMTMGASAGDLVAMVMRQGLTPVIAGLIAGIAAALALGKVLAGLLFGVQAGNWAVIASISLVLLAVAALACALPARRATRVSPASVLRS